MSSVKYQAVIPAAGAGSRMQSEIPKQYLKLCGKTILEHTAGLFLNHPRINQVVIVVSPGDPFWETTTLASRTDVITAKGGSERCNSVLNGLAALTDSTGADDWILVHDAARPCLSEADIDRLIDGVSDHPVGGILAVQVRDTMKRSNDSNEITETIERDRLWHAMTPQMFRYKKLMSALESAINNQQKVTDEASAIELTGVKPLLIPGDLANIKITQMGDLGLAEFYLQQRG